MYVSDSDISTLKYFLVRTFYNNQYFYISYPNLKTFNPIFFKKDFLKCIKFKNICFVRITETGRKFLKFYDKCTS